MTKITIKKIIAGLTDSNAVDGASPDQPLGLDRPTDSTGETPGNLISTRERAAYWLRPFTAFVLIFPNRKTVF